MEINPWNLKPGPKGELEIPNKGRGDLADWLGTCCYTGAEIGVAHGHFSKRLMEANPKLILYGIDPYKVYSEYKDYALQKTMAQLKADAHAQLDQYPTYKFIEKMSMDALEDFPDESLDFVYIDANHEDPFVTEDITQWAKKVRKGGVVSGHDYARVRSIRDRYDVVNAVNRYVQKNNIQLYVWGLNSKADPTLIRDNIRSWMFVR